MNCKELQGNLVSYIKGELGERDEEDFVSHVRKCPECYEELDVYTTVFAGLKQLDGEQEQLDYGNLVEEALQGSQANIQDEHFLYNYVFLMKTAALAALFYMIVSWRF